MLYDGAGMKDWSMKSNMPQETAKVTVRGLGVDSFERIELDKS